VVVCILGSCIYDRTGSRRYAQCIALPVAALETLGPAVLVGVVLVSAVVVDVLLVVHLLGVLLGLTLGLLAVEPVLALGLRELLYVSTIRHKHDAQHTLSTSAAAKPATSSLAKA
jgi:hypothetical protein